MTRFELMDTSNWSGTCHLADLAVIEADGPDAASFLHSQLSQDMLNLGVQRSALAAYCSPKGRMLASLWVWRAGHERFYLVVDQSILAPTLKRLSMFVLRARCKLRDASAEWAVLGTVQPAGSGADEAWPEPFQSVPGSWHTGTGSRLGWTLVPATDVHSMLSGSTPVSLAHWRWLAVLSGVPAITAPTVDQFVPQMVNLELIGGVNFQKGCYPGQEVVARSQYRGTTKRRLFLVQSDTAITPGQEVFSEADPEQPAGMVVNVAALPHGASAQPSWHALIELKISAMQQALRAGDAAGPVLLLGALPYEVPLSTD